MPDLEHPVPIEEQTRVKACYETERDLREKAHYAEVLDTIGHGLWVKTRAIISEPILDAREEATCLDIRK